MRITGLVQFETVKEFVAKRVPPHTVEANMKALQLGWDAAENVF